MHVLKASIAVGSLLATLLAPMATSPLARADIPPDDRKAEEGEKLEPSLDGGDDFFTRLVDESEKNLQEINRLLDDVQKELGNRQTGSPTQQKQGQAAKKMEELLQQLEDACSKCSQGGGSSQQDQKQSSGEEQKKDEQKKPGDPKSQEEQAREQQRLQAQQPKPEKEGESEKEKKTGDPEQDQQLKDGIVPPARPGTLGEALDGARRWGLLPPKLRDEVLFSSGKETPPEYREIISRYYKRMTEVYEKSRDR